MRVGREGLDWLIASLLYGSGMRLMESARLRLLELDFERKQITVGDGKGGKHRITMLPEHLIRSLCEHLAKVEAVHDQALSDGFASSGPQQAVQGDFRRAVETDIDDAGARSRRRIADQVVIFPSTRG